MTTTLRNFIISRKAEIKQNISALKAELIELQRAEDALPPTTALQHTHTVGRKSTNDHSVKTMALKALAELEKPADVATIITKISEIYSVNIERRNLSPQLSKLGKQGVLQLNGTLWKLNKLDMGVFG